MKKCFLFLFLLHLVLHSWAQDNKSIISEVLTKNDVVVYGKLIAESKGKIKIKTLETILDQKHFGIKSGDHISSAHNIHWDVV